MRPNQELIAVKYFSAKPSNIDQSLRQNAFFQVNQENPKFRLILGKYLKKEITCFKCGNVIHTHEEKETDVRIATQIVADAYQKNGDAAIERYDSGNRTCNTGTAEGVRVFPSQSVFEQLGFNGYRPTYAFETV